jgi:TRAP-type C4-dicarboxylate transport system permease small subunit
MRGSAFGAARKPGRRSRADAADFPNKRIGLRAEAQIMKSFMNKFTLVTDKICYYVSYLSMAVIVIMMFLISIDVALGKLFNFRITGTYEISQMILSVLVFSSWAYTQTVHGHIQVVMFVSKMPQKLRFFCYGLTSIVSMATMIIAGYAVYHQILAKYVSNERTGTLLIAHWPFYIFEFVALILLSVVLLRDAIKSIAAMVSNEFAEEIQSTWV